MNPTIVFDFDKTLTYKDTLLDFFVMCGKGRGFFRARIAIYGILAVLSKLKLVSNHGLKDYGVKLFLQGMTKSQIEDTGRRYAPAIRLNKVYSDQFLRRFPNAYVVSASFPEYLRPIFGCERLLASSIRYEGEKPVGLERNCYHGTKAVMLREIGVLHIDSLYTDSGSDYPLAEMASKVFIVRGDDIIECESLSDFRRKA